MSPNAALVERPIHELRLAPNGSMNGAERIPHFPCWGVILPEPVEDARALATEFTSWRISERWLLLGPHAAISERQLWTAWIALGGRLAQQTMISRSLDGEFMRLLAGTHQMRLAFERAGLTTGDTQAWLVHLPEWPEEDMWAIAEETGRSLDEVRQEFGGSTASHLHADLDLESLQIPTNWPALDRIELDQEAARLFNVLRGKLLTERPMARADARARLALPDGDEAPARLEADALAHIALADLES